MTPAVELVDFATRYKLRIGKLPTAMPVTQDEAQLFDRPTNTAEIVSRMLAIEIDAGFTTDDKE